MSYESLFVLKGRLPLRIKDLHVFLLLYGIIRIIFLMKNWLGGKCLKSIEGKLRSIIKNLKNKKSATKSLSVATRFPKSKFGFGWFEYIILNFDKKVNDFMKNKFAKSVIIIIGILVGLLVLDYMYYTWSQVKEHLRNKKMMKKRKKRNQHHS